MGFNGSGAASGAASGASAGMAFGPWGAAIGGVAGGLLGGFSGGSSVNAPQPTTMPGPTALGSINGQYGGLTYDPATGSMNQYGLGFDPTQMGAYWDAQSMYNQFMGRDNSGMTSDLDWQIQKLQQQLEQARGNQQSSRATVPAEYQELVSNYTDPKTGKLLDISNADQIAKNPDANPQYQGMLKEFWSKDRHGLTFKDWISDHYDKVVKPLYQNYQKTQQAQTGNQQSTDRYTQDLQNQIDYLGQQRNRLAGPSQGQNPLMGYLQNQGPTWKGGDNSNPYLPQWEQASRDRLAQSGQDPRAQIDEYAGPQSAFRNQMQMYLGQLGGHGQQAYGLNAPSLNLEAAGQLPATLNAQTFTNYTAQNKARDAANAERGMGSSAVNEMAHANDALNLTNALHQNTLSGLNAYNSMVGQQFGMNAQAQGLTNAAAGQNNQDELARRGLQLQYTGQLENQGLARAALAQQIKNNLFQQAMSSLNANNAMRQQTRDWNVQDYGIGRQENEQAYQRNLGMYGLLNNQRQQAFGNAMTQGGMNLQGIGTFMPAQMQYANQQNQANMGNWQNQNAWNMYNAQNQQARSNANQAGMWNAIGSLGNAWGRNYNPGGGSPGGQSFSDPSMTGSQWTYNQENPFASWGK